MSIEQAKAIKAKREFAQELEDVKDFEKKVVGRSEGRSRKKLGSGSNDAESSDEDEGEDEDEDGEDDKPRKKRIVCDFRILQNLLLTKVFFLPAECSKQHQRFPRGSKRRRLGLIPLLYINRP